MLLSRIISAAAAAGGSVIKAVQSDAGAFTVPIGVSVGDLVYLSGLDSADEADNSSSSTTPAAAIVIEKPTSTTATLLYLGESSTFSGLTSGSPYFLDTAGGITLTSPTTTGSVIQVVGIAINTTTLLFFPLDIILL